MAAVPSAPERFGERPRGPSTTPAMAPTTAPAAAARAAPPGAAREGTEGPDPAPGDGTQDCPGHRREDEPEKAREPINAAVHVAQPVFPVLRGLEVAPRVGRRLRRGVRVARRPDDARLLVPVGFRWILGHSAGLRRGAPFVGPASRLPATAPRAVLTDRNPPGQVGVPGLPRPPPSAGAVGVS